MRSKILAGAFGLLLLNGLSGCGDGQKNEMQASENAARKTATEKGSSAASPANPHGGPTMQPAIEAKDDLKVVAEAPVGDVQKLKVGTLEFTVPSTWKNEVPSTMRMAQYSIPKVGDDKEDGVLSLSNFGGGIEANLTRWAGQMGVTDASKGRKQLKTADGLEATFAEFEGAYMGMGDTPKLGYKMLVGYFVRPNGEFQLKLTGPAATINAAKAGFEKMIESFK